MPDENQQNLPLDSADPPADPTPAEPVADPRIDKLEAGQKQIGEQMGQLVAAMQGGRPAVPAAPAADPNAALQQLNEQMWNNPATTGAQIAAEITQRALAQDRQARYPTERENAKRIAVDNHKDVFDKYGAEVDAFLTNNYDPQFHTNPHVWDTAAKAVKAEHVEDYIKEAQQKSEKASNRNDGPGAPSPREPQRRQQEDQALTEEEDKAAEIFFPGDDKKARAEKYARGKQNWSKLKVGACGPTVRQDCLQSPLAKETVVVRDPRSALNGHRVPLMTFDNSISSQKPKWEGS